jgi:hypothetical protein
MIEETGSRRTLCCRGQTGNAASETQTHGLCTFKLLNRDS